jgi:transcriptional regulator with XRE-family HTH domain
MDRTSPPRWASRLVELRAARQWGRRELARRLREAGACRGESLPAVEHLVRAVRRWESGSHRPSELYRELLARVHDLPPAALFGEPVGSAGEDQADDVDELLDLARRAEASDVGDTALDAIDLAVAELARRYSYTPPADLLVSVRRRSQDVIRLLAGSATIDQRRRLLVAGGWLSLLTATVHVDLAHRVAARIARDTAAALGREAGEPELLGWSVEGASWEAIVNQEWPTALRLAREGQEIAPAGRSGHVQLTVQEARAAARLGDAGAVHAALDRAGRALQRHPGAISDHHFVFDPNKLTGYTATALTWLGDPAAEEHAREVIRITTAPRRLATARIDLALVVLGRDRPDEATALGGLAVDSRCLVPSNIWRAAELDRALADRYADLPETRDYHERYRVAATAAGLPPPAVPPPAAPPPAVPWGTGA